jgi:hypothetical protein
MELNHIKIIKDVLIEANQRAAVASKTKIHFEIVAYWMAATTEQVTDLACFIEYFRRRGKNVIWIAANVYHDIAGAVNDEKCFLPRSNGFAAKLAAEMEVTV